MNSFNLYLLKNLSPISEIERLLDSDLINAEQRNHLIKIQSKLIEKEIVQAYVMLKEMDEYGPIPVLKPLYAVLQFHCLRAAYPNKTDDDILSSYLSYHLYQKR